MEFDKRHLSFPPNSLFLSVLSIIALRVGGEQHEICELHSFWALRPQRLLQGRRSLRPTICEGRCPSALPMRGCSAPPPRGILQGRKSLLLQCRRSALHPGDFPVAGKVTKGAPRAAPLDLPVQGYRPFRARCASRRATFCHRKRPICHFEMVGKSAFVVSFGFDQEKYSAVNPWRGGFGCTFGCNFWGDSGYRWRGFLRGTRHYSATKSGQRSLV